MKPEEFKEISKSFRVSPFGYTIHVVSSNDIARSAKAREKAMGKLRDLKPTMVAFTAYPPGLTHAWVFTSLRAGCNTVAHECFHLVHWLLSTSEVKFEEEVYAYHLGDIVERVSKIIYQD